MLLIPGYTDAQTTNLDAYIQYKIDFKQREMEFVRQLRESQPGITKAQVKEELRQYYRDNFDPPVFPGREESIEKDPSISKELQLKTIATTTSTTSSIPFNQVPDALEYQALRDLFESTDGPNWSYPRDWDYPNWKDTSTVSYIDFEDWSGVTVRNGDVAVIQISRGVDGVIPASISNLEQLTGLFMNGGSGTAQNKLGPLPNTLGSLQNLERVGFSSCSLTGPVPEVLFDLPNIKSIGLGDNQLSSFPDIPAGKWGMLEALYISNNEISGSLPGGIENLNSLRDFWADHNDLSGPIPPGIGQLKKLERLDLFNNNISDSLPPGIGQLEELRVLNISWNNLSGPLPPGIGQLQKLMTLSLSDNNLSGSLPAEMTSQNLLEVYLNSNNLSGSIPGYFVDLPVVAMNFANNSFTSFPDFSSIVGQREIFAIWIQKNRIGWEYIEPNIQNGLSYISTIFQFFGQGLSNSFQVDWAIGSTGRVLIPVGGNHNLYRWEKRLSRGRPWTTVEGQTTNELVIPNVRLDDALQYRLYVYNELAGGFSGPASYSGIVTVEVVGTLPDPPLVSDNHICSNQAATLTATGTGTAQWYTDSLGGVPFHTGVAYTTPLLTETVTYYVSQVVSGAESDRVPISAIVGPVFTAAEDESICRGESLPIVIEGNNLSVDWGIEIGTQSSFVARPDTTTTYTYNLEDAFGCTASGQVTITVTDPVTAGILPPAPVCPGQTVTLEAEEVTGATYSWAPGGLTGRTVDVVINELQEYTLTVTGANGCTSQASILPELQTIAVTSEDREICVVDSVVLTAEGGDSYVWSTNATTPEITFHPTTHGVFTFTVTATRDGCSATDEVVVTVNEFCPGTPISFLARAISTTEIELNWQEPPGNHTEYVIQRQNASGVYETIATVPLGSNAWPDSGLQPGTVYFYRIYSQVGTAQSEMRFARARTFTPNQNYVMETEVLADGITDVGFVPNLNYHQRNSTWNYLNGLGSDMQTVVEGASPSEKDVVQPIIYDQYGMRSKQYLSYTIAQPTRPGNFRDSAQEETTDFYATPPPGVASTGFPYAETVFDSSPQNKVLEQGSVGEAWQVSTGHTVTIDRTTNGTSDVLHWEITVSGLEATGYYPASQLKKTVTVNEDGETVLLYEDMLGRELMRTIQRADAEDITTYFVYNNRGSLLYRVTPNVVAGFNGSLPYGIDQTMLSTQCYSYHYDAQEKLVAEKWPDQEAIYYVYDRWDRLVLSQSGNQRLGNQWTFTKYDRFDRPVLTGLLNTSTAQDTAAMTMAIETHYATGGSRYETYAGAGGPVHGYSNASYPVLADVQSYLSVTYYDSYDFMQADTLFGASYAYDATALGCQNSPQGNSCFPAEPLKVLRGKVTGSKTRVLDRDQWLGGVVYYDEKGRTVQAVAQNHTGGIDRASTLHNFAGWPLATYSTLDAPGADTYAIQRRFVYDHAGRLKEGYHELFKNGVGQGEKFLAENVYNELGQLMEKNLHVEQNIPLQSVDYRYNIRGWLESINNVHFSDDGRNNDINDLFGMEMFYQDILPGVQPGN